MEAPAPMRVPMTKPDAQEIKMALVAIRMRAEPLRLRSVQSEGVVH
jgi:hypothetical protein